MAEGEDAQQAIEALAKAFVEGLGESVSFVPAVEDTIEGTAQPQAVESAKILQIRPLPSNRLRVRLSVLSPYVTTMVYTLAQVLF
ncbi:bifunctional PTS system fructose-specific transporter subunit IIA/HPr protein [Actinobacillus equuli]|nr:bifunctional PTS system fructose-specific transporter subunit IIA/HPr protein [Actinobacillus equuli]